jgi:uncharacterized phiE125 gp8 family phage protein
VITTSEHTTAVSGSEPITTAQAKAHLRFTSSAEDSLIDALVSAARKSVEEFTGRAIRPQARKLTLPRFQPVIRLWLSGAVTDLVIKYLDEDGAEQTLAGGNYRVSSGLPSELYLDEDNDLPGLYAAPDAVRITYTVTPLAAVEHTPLVQAILLLVGHLFDNRNASVTGVNSAEIPLGYQHLLNPYRIL